MSIPGDGHLRPSAGRWPSVGGTRYGRDRRRDRTCSCPSALLVLDRMNRLVVSKKSPEGLSHEMIEQGTRWLPPDVAGGLEPSGMGPAAPKPRPYRSMVGAVADR